MHLEQLFIAWQDLAPHEQQITIVAYIVALF